MAIDLDTGDINWAVQLGPLESWTYACLGAGSSPDLNLTGIDIYLSVPICLSLCTMSNVSMPAASTEAVFMAAVLLHMHGSDGRVSSRDSSQ